MGSRERFIRRIESLVVVLRNRFENGSVERGTVKGVVSVEYCFP